MPPPTTATRGATVVVAIVARPAAVRIRTSYSVRIRMNSARIRTTGSSNNPALRLEGELAVMLAHLGIKNEFFATNGDQLYQFLPHYFEADHLRRPTEHENKTTAYECGYCLNVVMVPSEERRGKTRSPAINRNDIDSTPVIRPNAASLCLPWLYRNEVSCCRQVSGSPAS